MPKSWNDLAIMPPMDPRGIISFASLQDHVAAIQIATFTRSSSWLKNTTWINPPMAITLPGPVTTSNIVATSPYDFQSTNAATFWNTTQAMTLPMSGLPISVQNKVFLKAGPFFNNIFLDFTGGATSTDIQLSMRDNSVTSGNFQDSSSGTIPVLAFPNITSYAGTGRNFQVTLTRTGRFAVALRIIDNSGNYSMFEMDWIVL